MSRYLTSNGRARALAATSAVGAASVSRSARAAAVCNPRAAGQPRPPGSPWRRQVQAGFHVCVEDLEDELIRAVGAARVVALIDSQGDLGSFRSLQRQPQWRGQLAEAQLRWFLGSGATRKLRYACRLAGAVDLNRLPHPLDAVLAGCSPR